MSMHQKIPTLTWFQFPVSGVISPEDDEDEDEDDEDDYDFC